MDSEAAYTKPRARLNRRHLYFVILPTDSGAGRYLFFWADPRRDGCLYPVADGADLDESQLQQDAWRIGESSRHVLARSNRSPLKFKAFRSELDIHSEWEILDGTAEVWKTWKAFTRAKR